MNWHSVSYRYSYSYVYSYVGNDEIRTNTKQQDCHFSCKIQPIKVTNLINTAVRVRNLHHNGKRGSIQALENNAHRRLLCITYRQREINKYVQEIILNQICKYEPLLSIIKRRKL